MAPAPASLRLYLACAPGCGKTSRLLDEARALQALGRDVVVAAVEPRGRREVLARLEGLEALPPLRLEFRGLQAEELDLAALLARRPQVAVVDDLAHVNAPGLRHRRRHEDVLALLEAGIEVVSALDVQHVERLGDVVERVAGFEERVTVPDRLLERAELLALDLPVAELRRRQERGAAGSGREALRRPEVLEALRELMLRECAERARARQLSAGEAARLPGRLLVALSSLSPRAGILLRQASRFAGRLDTSWFVAYVETPEEAPERIGGEARARLLRNVELARELGAEVVRLQARDPVPALVDFGRAHGVAHLLVGRSRPGRWRALWRRPPGTSLLAALRGPLHERLLRQAPDFDVYVVAQEERP